MIWDHPHMTEGGGVHKIVTLSDVRGGEGNEVVMSSKVISTSNAINF